MKRRIGLFLAAASILSAVGMFAPSPASAVPTGDVCVGQGEAKLGTGFGAPVITKNSTTFTFVFTTGACLVKTSLTAAGTVTGACGQSEGKGTTGNGDDFVFTSAGTALIITGEIVGAVSALSNPLVAGNSCTNKTATVFIITGVVAKNACNNTDTIVKGKVAGIVQTNVWVCV